MAMLCCAAVHRTVLYIIEMKHYVSNHRVGASLLLFCHAPSLNIRIVRESFEQHLDDQYYYRPRFMYNNAPESSRRICRCHGMQPGQ